MTMSTRFSQYRVLLTGEPVSFWQEKMIALVILLVAGTSHQMKEVLSFCYQERPSLLQ